MTSQLGRPARSRKSWDLLPFPLMIYMFYAGHLLDKNETIAESVSGMLQERDLYQEA